MKHFFIDDIEIGGDAFPLVIPEIGINHEGDINVAKEMVLSAHRAGARLIKHQTHIVEDEMSGASKFVIPGNSSDSIYDIMERCALTEEEEAELKEYTESLGMVFLSTPFSRAAADRLQRLGVHAYKIGSGELNNYPLIEYIARFGKPIILSTGMNDMVAIQKAVDILEKYGVDYALMHTTNLYPTMPYQVRLGAMQEMIAAYPDVPVGLSDHTLTNAACIAAVALGAKLVERHYTDIKERSGPDIVCSMDEEELKDLLQASRDVSEMLGGTKDTIDDEKITRDFAFATVVAVKDIRKGERLTEDNIWVKRPGTGDIPAEEYAQVLGRIANCDIHYDEQISWEMVL